MRIKSLKVDGYGVWSKLKLDRLGEGLSVLHGPNEAGKTTLMQFIRSMLFGFAPDRRRYLPPVYGGRPGGAIDLVSSEGRFRLSRHDDQQAPGPRATAVLSAPDGTRQGEPYLQTLLSNIDEPTFNNVFSVGLREIQQLGTLGDTEAASLLFRLTAGLDRVSLVDVTEELEASRRRLLQTDAGAGRIRELLAERDRLRRELAELDSLTSQYAQLTGQRSALDREVEQLEAQHRQLEQDARVLETAISVRQPWNRRATIDSQLAALHMPGAASEDALERFEHCDARLKQLRGRAQRLEHRRRQIRRRAVEIKVNEPLHRQAARIEAFREQEGWITTLRAKVTELENETRRLDEQLAEQRRSLGLDKDEDHTLPAAIGQRDSAALRRAAGQLRRRRATLAEFKSRAEQQSEAARAGAAELQTALASRGIGELGEAIDSAGNLAAGLRRRVQLDERIDQMDRSQTELQTQSRDLLARQILPLGLVVGLGAVFVFSVVMVIAGLFTPDSVIGSLRWPLAILGIGGVLVTLGMKIMLERSNARKLDACQKQTNMLQLQMRQAKEERESLDRSLPASGQSRATQLENAENNLAQLEELMPLDARRQAAEQEAATTQLQVRQAEEQYKASRGGWREVLRGADLPEGLSPKQVRDLLLHRDGWATLVRRSEQAQSELRLRQQELDAITDRVTQLATDAGMSVTSGNPIELLQQLSQSLREEESRIHQRRQLRLKARRLRRKRAKLEAAIRPLRRRRREYLEQLGVRNADELRQRREVFDQAAELRRQRRLLQSEMEAALAGQCSEAELAACLAGASEDDLETRWETIDKQLQALQAQRNECLERRGQLNAQLAELAEDRRPAQKRLELGCLQRRLDGAVRRWQVLALCGRILAAIKDSYEKERQPETLQEASEYLRRLTGGRYKRVWTPLGEDVLRVDDARGNVLPVEVLSQGTREQLFLALRLALVACYAKRGARLPLILDDVLVNFDTPRAKAAVGLLRDFARAGHQLLVFTCHDHIVSLFKSLKVDVRPLPGHRDTASGRSSATKSKKSSTSKKTIKRKRRKPARSPKPAEIYLEEETLSWDAEDEPVEVEDQRVDDETVEDEDDLWDEEDAKQPDDEQVDEDDDREEDDDEKIDEAA